MRAIKPLIVGIIGLVLVITFISLFIPSAVNTVQAESITASRDSIMKQLTDLHNWKNWQPVFKTLGDSIHINTGADSLQQATWMQNNRETILQVKETGADFIRFTLTSGNDLPGDHTILIQPTEVAATSQVQWQAVTHLRWYPWEKFSGIFIEKVSGPGYAEALKSLKEFLENQP